MLELLFASISLIFFIFSLIRFPLGSFQQIILLVVAALAMYLAFSVYTIQHATQVVSYPQQIITNANGGNTIIQPYNITYYSAPLNIKVNQLIWSFNLIYDIICCVFALMGLIIRFVRSI